MCVCAHLRARVVTVGRVGGRGSGKEGFGVEDNAVMEEEDRGAKSHW